MSVGNRRLAAAQRTAVVGPSSRVKRLGAWVVIVPALALFSFSVVAQAAGVGGKPDVAGAAAKVVPKEPAPSSGKKDDGGVVVVVDKGDGGLTEALGRDRGKAVCWISKSQLGRVSAVYRTTTSTLTVGGKTYALVTVYGADEKHLQSLLGTSPAQCRLVHVEHVFFLPFDPNLS